MFIQKVYKMANTKEYQIKINGLTESINAVDALNKQLDKLEQRMNTLSSAKISTGGGSASRGNNSASSEEESVQKEINKLKQQGQQLDAKILATQNEIYKRVDATKQLYKQTVADQKAIAAQERLVADSYSNTMAGMKSKLADLKSVINVTDIGDGDKIKKLTKEANELTQKLKEMEFAYGQFGRDVGNYDRVGQSVEKIKVNIDGTVHEFDSLKQATKAVRDEMSKLEYNGKADTKVYRQLEVEASKLAKAQLRVNSAMNDAKASSKAMDDLLDTMESFAALGQVGQGFSTLFGFDNSELEQQIAKLVALQNVLSGIEKIRQQMNTREGIGKWLSKGSDAVDTFVMKLTGAQKRMGMLVKESRAASIAVQGLSKALKALGAVTIAGGLMVLMDALTALVEEFKNFRDGGYKAGTATDYLTSKVETLNEQFDKTKQRLSGEFLQGLISQEEYASEKTKMLIDQIATLETELLNSDKQLKFTISKKSVDDLAKNLNGLAKAIDEFENQASGLDKFQAKLSSGFIGKLLWGTEEINDKKKEFQHLGEIIVETLAYKVDAAMGKANAEVEKFGHVTDETKKEVAELAKLLDKDPNVNSLFKQIDKFSDKGQYYIKVLESLKNKFIEFSNSIETPNFDIDPFKLAQLEIDAMNDGLAKQMAQIELNRKKEIADAENNEKLMLAINAKYKRERINAEKQFGKQYNSALADLQSIRIDMMNEGWEKEKKQLEHERDERIRSIRDSEILVGERTAAIRELYRNRIAKAEKEWQQQQIENYRSYLMEIQRMNNEIYSLEVSNSLGNVENRTFERTDKANKTINKFNYDDITKMKEYYDELLKIELDAAKNEEEIRQEALLNEINDAKKEEEIRHQRLVDISNGEYAKQLEKGLITQQQYNELIQKENAAHNAAMNALDKKYAAESTAITQEGLDKNYKAYSNYYQKVATLIRNKQDDIQRKLNSAIRNAEKQSATNFGFFNAKALGKEYDEAIKKQKEVIDNLRNELDNLDKDNKAGKIVGEEFEKRRRELQSSLDAAIQTLSNLENESRTIIDRFIANVNQYVQVLGQSIQQIMQAVWDYQDYQMDKEQDELDKWNEKIDKALDKQQEIVEEHKNNVDSIEDELATARGDRRQHLIDQLNAEIAAQRAAQTEEKKIQKQKEAAEKKQEALDKKRKQEEYERNVKQAFISWHLSIANGLATQPFLPVGLAMGALATALGAVQYALVKSQKPYAKGGQLDGGVAQGKRHRDGGIPVLGGRASIEGGEFITNRMTTENNIELLDYINSKHRKLNIDDFIDFYSSGKVKKNIINMSPRKTTFADGGVIPTLTNNYDFDDRLLSAFEEYSNRQVVVSVVDINKRQTAVRNVQVLAGVEND